MKWTLKKIKTYSKHKEILVGYKSGTKFEILSDIFGFGESEKYYVRASYGDKIYNTLWDGLKFEKRKEAEEYCENYKWKE